MSSVPGNKDQNKRENNSRNTDWTIIFPLKSSLFNMKSSRHVKSTERIRKKIGRKNVVTDTNDRLKIRRGSSMSDIDKVILPSSTLLLSNIVRNSTSNNKLSVSPASVPHSPYMSRSLLSSTTTVSVRGSIGDLMNQKKYGSSQWSVRSETLIAKTVPLSTVTPRHSPPPPPLSEENKLLSSSSFPPEIIFNDEEESSDDGPRLTVAQRTQRLARLLKHRKARYLFPKSLPETGNWKVALEYVLKDPFIQNP